MINYKTMLKLSKQPIPITLLHEDQEVNIHGIQFRVNKNRGWYLQGCYIHTRDVNELEDALHDTGQPTLENLAESYGGEGYLNRGIFPEFDSIRNLSFFYSMLKNILE